MFRDDLPLPTALDTNQEASSDSAVISMANPASVNCLERGGESEIVTTDDGSQIGMCRFESYACEEWALFRGECAIKDDEALIFQALLDKGLNLDGMKVQIFNHMGTYVEAGVVPDNTLGGGGYVFAVKDNGIIKILADGNGIIQCSSFSDYPDFPDYLVPECIDEQGNQVKR